MELLWDGGSKVSSNGPGHMTKMAAMPIYGKNLLLWNKKADDLETWYAASGVRVLWNDDPGLTNWSLMLLYVKSQISCGASMGWGNESEYNWFMSHDHDGHHIHNYMVKTFKNCLEWKGWWPCNFLYSIGYSSTTKFVQMMTLGWPWPCLLHEKFVS